MGKRKCNVIKILKTTLQRTPNRKTKTTKMIQEDIAWAENYQRMTGINPYLQDDHV